MTINTQSHNCFHWGKVFFLGLTLLFAGCGGGDDEPPNPSKAYQGQAILGPLIGAGVEIYTLSALNSAPVYTTTTSSGDSLDQAGLFTIPQDLIDDNELYLVKVTGGQDIDAEDNGSVDANPTSNQGAIHALLTPNQIRSKHFHVSILTELLYQRLYYLLAANYSRETVLAELNRRAALVLATDVDGDGDRDADDVAAWHPVRDATKLRHGFKAYQPMIAAVHNGDPLKEMPLTGYVISVLNIGEDASDLQVLDGIAYVAGRAAGLQIVDVHNPTKPILLSSLPLGLPGTPVSALAVAVANGIAYIASGGLKTIDVHDLANPVLLGSVDIPGFEAAAVTVVDGIAYLGGGRGLYVVDVHDPAKPLSLGAMDTQNTTQAIVVSDGILYQITCNLIFHGAAPSPVRIYDVHQPATPVLLAIWDLPGCGEIAVVNEFAYLGAEGGLQILDVHDPTTPRPIGLLKLEHSFRGVAVTQGFAYIGAYAGGIEVVDVRDPTNLTLLGLIENTGDSLMRDFSIADGLAYAITDSLRGAVPDSTILKIIDISNPFNAVMDHARVGSMDLDSPGIAPRDIAAMDKTVYVVGQISNKGDSLHVVDAQDPANPVLLGSLIQRYGFTHVAVTNGMAFVSNGDRDGLHVVDVNNPTSPTLIKSFNIVSTNDIATTSDITYVTTSSTTLDWGEGYVKFPASLYLLDAHNPATLGILGSLSFGVGPSGVRGVAVANGIAYVVVEVATIPGEGIDWRGLKVVDVRNSAQPVVIGSISFSSPFRGYYSSAVAVADGVAYVLYDDNVLQLVDVHNPSSPLLLRSIPLCSLEMPGNGGNIVVADSFAYIAGSAGVQVVDIRDPLNPTHAFSLNTSTATAIAISGGYVYVVGENVVGRIGNGLQIFQAPVRQVP